MLKKSEVPVPQPLAEETVPVPELGGDVLVRGLMLKNRLELSITEGYERMSAMLAASVLVSGDDGAMVPMLSAAEWELFGARHYSVALKLWDTSRRLADIEGEEAAKK